ncbi:hypothetical protein KR054_006854 [Drosophila jambulina]|nr:hypothetical protein KR054_006854 [Drosophila jambulina]
MEQLIARRRRCQRKADEGSICQMLPNLKYKGLKGLGRRVKTQVLRVLPSAALAKNSLRFLKRCTKPNRQEFQRTSLAIAIGFLIMGTIGFAVKLIHIPITSILMS